jgi:hypothetical protein
VPFLLKACIGRSFGTGMRLANENIHEVHLRAPMGMKLF